MANELLHCCICPKRPDFSDTSHLLTHVSSKGHLSHLHKLQVRSHQEVSAGQQLASYNQWFTDHNVAHLLSERMQQKEKKQAKRKEDNKRRFPGAKQESGLEIDPSLLPVDAHSTIGLHGYVIFDNGSLYGSEHASGYTDAQKTDYVADEQSRLFLANREPVGSEWPHEDEGFDGVSPLATDMTGGTTLDIARLKGTIWPGMDMFDSADEETQRKRNQRKDISVLRRMQSMSELIEPMEAVCSPGGTVKKKRHLDDIEDDSPVEGESPLMKQSSKRKRKSFAAALGNTSHLTLRRPKAARAPLKTVATPTKRRSTTTKSQRDSRRYVSSLRDNAAACEMYSDSTTGRRKRPDFAIFDQASAALDSSLPSQTLSNPFLDEDRFSTQPDSLLFPLSAWLPSPQQAAQAYDPFRDYRSVNLTSESHGETAKGKENWNPLTWQRRSKGSPPSPVTTTYGSIDDFEDNLGALAEVYAFTRNPLIDVTPKHNHLDKTTCNGLAIRHHQTPIR